MSTSAIDGQRVLVTGASGFIGRELVKVLLQRGCQVSLLLRSSNRYRARIGAATEDTRIQFFEADLASERAASQIHSALQQQDFVFHLAGLARANSLAVQEATNVGGIERLLAGCAGQAVPPTTVFVSTLAAVGPSLPDLPHDESALCSPVSNYGRTKAAAERVAHRFADRVPISIVRPPIVLGSSDARTATLYRMIERWRIHVVSARESMVSVIHVDDLVDALIMVAERGERAAADRGLDGGVYFAAADEQLSYEALGRSVSAALGNAQPLRVIRVPPIALRAWGWTGTRWGALRGRPCFLNRDKVAEVLAGSWQCYNSKLKQQVGWQVGLPFAQRLAQIAGELQLSRQRAVSAA